jgi:hypothetical protein
VTSRLGYTVFSLPVAGGMSSQTYLKDKCISDLITQINYQIGSPPAAPPFGTDYRLTTFKWLQTLHGCSANWARAGSEPSGSSLAT